MGELHGYVTGDEDLYPASPPQTHQWVHPSSNSIWDLITCPRTLCRHHFHLLSLTHPLCLHRSPSLACLDHIIKRMWPKAHGFNTCTVYRSGIRNLSSILSCHSIMMGTIKGRECIPSLQLYNNLHCSRSSSEPLFHHSEISWFLICVKTLTRTGASQ